MLEVYKDDMIVKTKSDVDHVADLIEVIAKVQDTTWDLTSRTVLLESELVISRFLLDQTWN